MNASTYHHGDLRRALLQSAEDILAEQGLQALTLRACARRAGVSHAAPKHHFGDLCGLQTAVAELGYERLLEALQTAIEPVLGDLDEEFYAVATAYVGFAQAYPEHFRIMFRADLLDVKVNEPPQKIRQTFAELTNVILRQRGEQNLSEAQSMMIDSDDLLDDVLIGWCNIHGYAHLRIEGQLDMVPVDTEAKHLRRMSQRMAHAIQQPTH